jgi:hypothetical protein
MKPRLAFLYPIEIVFLSFVLAPAILWCAEPPSSRQVMGCVDRARTLPLIATKVEILSDNLSVRLEQSDLSILELNLEEDLWVLAGCSLDLHFLNWLPSHKPNTKPSAILEAQFTDHNRGSNVWLTFVLKVEGQEPIFMPLEYEQEVYNSNAARPPGDKVGTLWREKFSGHLRAALLDEDIRRWLAETLGKSVALTKEEKFHLSEQSHRLWLPLREDDLAAEKETKMRIDFQFDNRGAGLPVAIPSPESKFDEKGCKDCKDRIQVDTSGKLKAAYPYNEYEKWSQIAPLFQSRRIGQTAIFMEHYFGRFSGTKRKAAQNP